MYIGASIALIAFGAILRYAIADTLSGVDLATIGLILMIAGGIGLVVSLVQTAMYRDAARGRRGVAGDRRDYLEP